MTSNNELPIHSKPTSASSPTLYFNNPSKQADVSIHISATDKVRNEQILKAIAIICPDVFQKTIRDADNSTNFLTDNFIIKSLGGGLSNYLYTVTCKHNPTTPTSVLIRIHVGEEDDRFVNRNVENKIMAWLSQQQLSPLYYGRFRNGRIEQFYPNYRTLSCHEMSSQIFAPQIAHQMALLHLLNAPSNICQTELHQEAHIWSRIDAWFQLIFQTQSQHANNSKLKALQVESLMYKEWSWLKSTLSLSTSTSTSTSSSSIPSLALAFSRQTVFAHMDLQSLNILYPQTTQPNNPTNPTPSIKLIDFEYAGHNPRAADIANTFCEHCDCNNLCPDYQTEYPTKAQQITFLSNYLHTIANSKTSSIQTPLPIPYHPHTAHDNDDWNAFVEEFRKDVNRFSLLSHLGWAVWSVAQALNSPIDFDYYKYAKIRMEGYHWAKNSFF